MHQVLESMKFGLKMYLEKDTFGALTKLKNKSNFDSNGDQALVEAGVLIFGEVIVVLLILSGWILGFIAVSRICTGTDNRSKNIRLGLYALLIFTGGKIGYIYSILWLFRTNICA
jgi:hypothetical protein